MGPDLNVDFNIRGFLTCQFVGECAVEKNNFGLSVSTIIPSAFCRMLSFAFSNSSIKQFSNQLPVIILPT